jgi:hypothetical protein
MKVAVLTARLSPLSRLGLLGRDNLYLVSGG